MFSALRNRLSYANVAATLALIFAITGGAFAATGGGNSSSSHATLTAAAAKSKPKAKTGPRGPAGPKGATGATGATGVAGPAGATGPAGPGGPTGPAGAGTPGEKGAAGESVTIAPAGSKCLEGGTKFSNSTGEGAACNGEPGAKGPEGSPWTAGGTLPSGATETGTWSAHFEPGKTEDYFSSAISFPVPLAAPIGETGAVYVSTAEQTGKKVPAGCKAKVAGVETEGSAERPLAAKGNLCVYQGGTEEPAGTTMLGIPKISPPGHKVIEAGGAGTAGALVHIQYEGPSNEVVEIQGSWAVTAP